MAANFDKWKLDIVAKHFKLEFENTNSEPSSDNCDFIIVEDASILNGSKESQQAPSSSADEKVSTNTAVVGSDNTEQLLDDSMAIQLAVAVVDCDLFKEVNEDVHCEEVTEENVTNVENVEITFSGFAEKLDYSKDSLAGDKSKECFINQDVRFSKKKAELKGNVESSFVKIGRNCASFILIWEKEEFYKKLGGRRGEGKIRIRNLMREVSRCLGSLADDLKFESQSTIGNQVRIDFVFSTWEQAKGFVEKVKESVERPNKVTLRAYLLSEEYYGLKLEPVLTEEDVLLLAKVFQGVHLFRHFLGCRILTDGDNITFRFNSHSDINLFLYNKAHARTRTLGELKRNVLEQQIKLEADKEGILTLQTKDLSMGHNEWTDLGTRFMFRTRKKGDTKYLLFKNKKDLFYFYASDDAKELRSLCLTKSQIIVNRAENLEHPIRRSKEMELKIKSQLAGKEKELIKVKVKVLQKEKEIKAQKHVIQKLSKELSLTSDCIPSTLRLQDILKLKFKEENESSSNYLPCLRSFLQTDNLKKVEEVGGDIILTFSSSSKLERLLTSQCCKTVKIWSEISKLPQRAGFVSDKLYKDYGLLVYLEETSILVKNIKQVEDELKIGQAKVEYRSFGFAARFPTMLSFLQALVNRELYSHHRVMFMQESVAFMGSSGHVKFFNGKVCLTEEDFLRLQWKREELNSLNPNGSFLESFVIGLSTFLIDTRINEVCQDWNCKIVLTFATQQDLESLLHDHCETRSNSILRLFNLPCNLSFAAFGSLYSLRCPPDVDFRDLFKIDDTCFISQDPLQISAKHRIFPFLCLNNPELRSAYPGLSFQLSNFVEL